MSIVNRNPISSFSGTGWSKNSMAWKRWLFWNNWPLQWSKKKNNLKGTVTRFCACAATWFFLANSFSRLAFGEEILFHRPRDARESHNISIQELFGPFGKFENAIFCIFVQVLSRKFEVIEKNRTMPSSLLSVFLQTDQMWPLMWSSGFHFRLSRFSSQLSTFDGYFWNEKYVKRS